MCCDIFFNLNSSALRYIYKNYFILWRELIGSFQVTFELVPMKVGCDLGEKDIKNDLKRY